MTMSKKGSKERLVLLREGNYGEQRRIKDQQPNQSKGAALSTKGGPDLKKGLKSLFEPDPEGKSQKIENMLQGRAGW